MGELKAKQHIQLTNETCSLLGIMCHQHENQNRKCSLCGTKVKSKASGGSTLLQIELKFELAERGTRASG